MYTILKAEDLFIKTIPGDDHLFRSERFRHQLHIIARKEHILENHLKEYTEWYTRKTFTPPVTKAELLIEIITMWSNFGLVHYELLKRFFLNVLDIEKLSTQKHKIKTGSTYGTIVKSFKLLPDVTSETLEMLDSSLRNALAHDSWYIENNQFTYKLNKDVVQMTFPTAVQKLKNIGQVYSTIYRCYLQDFAPEAIQDYEAIGQANVNKIFPMYGMDTDNDTEENSNKRPGFGYKNENGELIISELPSDIASFVSMSCEGCISWIMSGIIPKREDWTIEHGDTPYPFGELYEKYGAVWNEDLFKMACSTLDFMRNPSTPHR